MKRPHRGDLRQRLRQNRIQSHTNHSMSGISPKAKGVILLIFYKRDNIAELKVEQ